MPPTIQVMWDAVASRRWFGLLKQASSERHSTSIPEPAVSERQPAAPHGTTAGPILVVAAAFDDPNQAQP
jgi:hypothetical protein